MRTPPGPEPPVRGHYHPCHPAAHVGDPTLPLAGADGSGGAIEEATRLREENAMFHTRLADDLALLRDMPTSSRRTPHTRRDTRRRERKPLKHQE